MEFKLRVLVLRSVPAMCVRFEPTIVWSSQISLFFLCRCGRCPCWEKNTIRLPRLADGDGALSSSCCTASRAAVTVSLFFIALNRGAVNIAL